MSDLYCEQLVRRRMTGADMVKKAALIAVTVILFAISLLIPYLLFVPVLLIVLDVFLLKRMNVEYEYLFVNGELDIDKIMGKEKRKKQLSMDVNMLEVMAPKGSHGLDSYKNRQMKVLDYTSRDPEARVYEMIVNQEKQQVRVYFEPNDTIVEGMYLNAPRKVFRS